MKTDKKVNVRVEYDITPVRHIAVQCPECGRWFNGRDITDKELFYSYQINYVKYHCPVCDEDFDTEDSGVNITECYNADVVFKDCLRKREIWE